MHIAGFSKLAEEEAEKAHWGAQLAFVFYYEHLLVGLWKEASSVPSQKSLLQSAA